MKKNTLVILLIFTLIFSACSIPSMLDLELNNETEIYGGHGDICLNAYIETECMEGLACRTVTTKPYETKVCLNPHEEIPEDLVYKHTYDNNFTTIKEQKAIRNS